MLTKGQSADGRGGQKSCPANFINTHPRDGIVHNSGPIAKPRETRCASFLASPLAAGLRGDRERATRKHNRGTMAVCFLIFVALRPAYIRPRGDYVSICRS